MITETSTARRIESIDLLRGTVMIIMALDHTRDFFHITAMTADPLNPDTTSVWLFFTRWITHFCAPVFLLLSGISAALSSQKKTLAQTASFLIKRGIWLILIEIVVITLGLTFNPLYNVLILQVIWATGWSMLILGLLVRLPFPVILCIALAIFFGHNLLDHVGVPQNEIAAAMLKVFFTARGYILPLGGNHFIAFLYAILPWTGVMILGYCMGNWFGKSYDISRRKKYLLLSGLGMIALFIFLRVTNLYGNPEDRAVYNTPLKNILSFLNTSKYPPSLQYLCMTLGPALILLAMLETVKGKLSSVISVYGKVPFFYYVLHFYLLHLLLVIIFFISGYHTSEIVDQRLPFLFRPMTFGFGLPIVYLIWMSVVAVLYRPCRWFSKYKATHAMWWLKYL